MFFGNKIIEQLKPYLRYLVDDIVLSASLKENDKNSEIICEMLDMLTRLTTKITVSKTTLSRSPSIAIDKKIGDSSGVVFSAVPAGHEFTSFILAILHVSGHKPKIDNHLIEKIKKIDTDLDFVTYVNVSCHNCPEVVQLLNMMAALNLRIKHTVVDGALFLDEVNTKGIESIPAVYLNSNKFSFGAISLEEILRKIAITTLE